MISRMSLNNAPTHPQEGEDQIIMGGDIHTTNNGPVRISNGTERDTSPGAAGSLLKSIHPVTFRNCGGGRRVSWDRNNFRSSLRTIESCAASSLDIYDGEDDDSHLRGSEQSSSCASLPRAREMMRRRSLEMNGSSAQSLMVSFSRLNEQELTNLRKWNRRLQRTEVFDKYYFPAKWEANEMEALIGFLKLEDPTSKLGGGLRGGSLRGSGNKSKNKNPLSDSGSRRKKSERSRQASSSWHSGGSDASAGLSNSFTSLKDSAGKLSKLLVDPKQHNADPVKVTKQALDFIFFPYVHDPKSVLLKRGGVFLHDDSLPNERELMIFTHGFLLANVVLEDAFSLFLALSDREFLTEKSFLDNLQNKFREMDEEETGEIDKWELQKLFTDMGIPMGESVLDELIKRSIISITPHDGDGQCEKVDWGVLHKALQGFFVHQNNASAPSGNVKALGLNDSGHVRDHGGDETGLKKLLGAFQKGKKTTKVEYAALFSNVARVDSLNICHGEDSTSRELANSTYAQTAFSVTLKDRENDPLIFVCSKPEHRDSWVEAFRPGLVRALTKSSGEGMSELRSKVGWQHLVIRASFASLVLLNDLEGLECSCQENSGEGSCKKLRLELNLLDEYNGYSPLHYATILGNTECMEVLLEAGCKVTIEDREGQSPMYHALSLRNDEVANVLEKFGADRSDDLRKLIAHEIQEEELKDAPTTSKMGSGRLETHIENNSLALDSSETSEDIDALLMQAANSTQLGRSRSSVPNRDLGFKTRAEPNLLGRKRFGM